MDCLRQRALLYAVALLVLSIHAHAGPHGATDAGQNLPDTGKAATPPFKIGIELPCQVPTSTAVERALQTMGVQYVNYYLRTALGIKDRPADEIAPKMLDLCARLGVDYSIATHQLDPPDDSVRDAVRASEAADGRGRFRGVVFDELAHIRLLNYDRPLALADYAGFKTLEQAWAETLAGYERLRAKFEDLGSPVVATHVFPILLHTAARAGFTVCPKICKEFYSPVSLAIGLGAAWQYGRDLWADVDLWYWAMVPGHSPDEFRCSLLLAYWLGVDLTYVEGAGHNLRPAGDQGIPFSLVTVTDAETFQLTPHGEALRWFAKEYVPRNPRPYTFREVRPTIAILRFEDTDYGIRSTRGFTPGLYGTENLRTNADTEAWLGLWNLLTSGATGSDGLSFFKARVGMTAHQRNPDPGEISTYLTRPDQAEAHSFFVPLNNVVVLDHLASYEQLADIPLIFLTGVTISEQTLASVGKRVSEGATCVVWAPLARRLAITDEEKEYDLVEHGKGKWVITNDWSDGRLFEQVWMHVGRSDEIRYRFGDHTVVLKRLGDNHVEVLLDGVVRR